MSEGKFELVSPVDARTEKEIHHSWKVAEATQHGLVRAGTQMFSYVFLQGLALMRLQELLPHGQFLPQLEERLKLPKTTAYGRVNFAKAMLGKFPTVGNLPKGVRLPTVGGYRRPVNKKTQALLMDLVPQIMDGKGMVEFMRGAKFMREPKPAGGFRPDKEALEAWLKEHHPELAGQEYDALPAEVQKAFRKDYKPRLDPWMIQEGHKAFWADLEQKLGRGLEEKMYVELDQEALERLRMLFVDAAHTLKAAQRKS